jgi:hypothetical protein
VSTGDSPEAAAAAADYNNALAHLRELTDEYNEAAGQYFSARDHLYDGVRQVVAAEMMPKLHISRITGISRPTIDKICDQRT